MYAALIEIDVSGVDREAGLAGLRDHIVPAVTAMPGFHTGVWLTGDDAGKRGHRRALRDPRGGAAHA